MGRCDSFGLVPSFSYFRYPLDVRQSDPDPDPGLLCQNILTVAHSELLYFTENLFVVSRVCVEPDKRQ